VAADDLRDPDDVVLVGALRAGDEQAMAEILRRHRLPVVAFARRLLGDAARADEVAQDVFVRLWERSERFDGTRGTLRAFLLTLTHGRALDVSRADTARARREEHGHSRMPTPRNGADTPVVARSVADALHAALRQIPEAERRAVELAYLGGHSYRTVAAMLGEPEGTIKSRIRSGLSRLRAALAAQQLHVD
jgi:RNA polymerase sigma-70 factor (ECF subfamily)